MDLLFLSLSGLGCLTLSRSLWRLWVVPIVDGQKQMEEMDLEQKERPEPRQKNQEEIDSFGFSAFLAVKKFEV